MGAAAIVLPDRQRLGSAVAFGSLLDLARLRREPGEVCEVCQTLNAGHAYHCKGCDGKLPAYFAAADAGVEIPPPAVAAETERRRSGLVIGALVVLWGVVTAVALLQAQGPRAEPEPMSAQAAPNAVVERVSPIVPAAAFAERAAPVRMEPLQAVSVIEAPREARALVALTPTPTSSADADVDRPLRRAGSPTPPPSQASQPFTRQARNSGPTGSVARCEGRNFFARAVCMNTQCARPDMRRSAQCAETVRQSRLGEARRNPKLAG
ncbi:hypothetical protein [Variovorax sp. KK3]|uniref:hypothetical protein n=1 Tax=Variovorax sp. KK3 TaxID=1855728 RepID=UPI00097BBE3A|nr:hypothetical protein [Variovorax sp. KK3]